MSELSGPPTNAFQWTPEGFFIGEPIRKVMGLCPGRDELPQESYGLVGVFAEAVGRMKGEGLVGWGSLFDPMHERMRS